MYIIPLIYVYLHLLAWLAIKIMNQNQAEKIFRHILQGFNRLKIKKLKKNSTFVENFWQAWSMCLLINFV